MTGSPAPAIITLTTDFGHADPYVGAVKGAILSVTRDVHLVDISHDGPPHDIAAGAWILAQAIGSFPPGTVHLAVVDPGVGTARRPLIARAGPHLLVGPDNGIFSFVFARHPPTALYAIDAARVAGPRLSSTFHARDLFGPAAARLARGDPPDSLGAPCAGPVLIPAADPTPGPGGAIAATVVHIDRFGNVILGLTRDRAVALLGVEAAGRLTTTIRGTRIDRMVATYGEAPDGAAVLLYNSTGFLECGAYRRRADTLLRCHVGDRAEVRART